MEGPMCARGSRERKRLHSVIYGSSKQITSVATAAFFSEFSWVQRFFFFFLHNLVIFLVLDVVEWLSRRIDFIFWLRANSIGDELEQWSLIVFHWRVSPLLSDIFFLSLLSFGNYMIPSGWQQENVAPRLCFQCLLLKTKFGFSVGWFLEY